MHQDDDKANANKTETAQKSLEKPAKGPSKDLRARLGLTMKSTPIAKKTGDEKSSSGAEKAKAVSRPKAPPAREPAEAGGAGGDRLRERLGLKKAKDAKEAKRSKPVATKPTKLPPVAKVAPAFAKAADPKPALKKGLQAKPPSPPPASASLKATLVAPPVLPKKGMKISSKAAAKDKSQPQAVTPPLPPVEQATKEKDPNRQSATGTLVEMKAPEAVGRSSALDAYLEHYQRELDAEPEGPSVIAARIQLASGRLLELEGLSEEAKACFAKALDRDPESTTAMHELRRLARKEDAHQEVAGLLEREAEIVGERARRTALLEELARIQAQQDPAAALETIDRVLALSPEELSAQVARWSWLVQSGRWDELAQVAMSLADLIRDPADQVAYLLSSAELLEHRQDKAQEAADRYVKSMQLAPPLRGAFVGAERTLYSQQRWRELYGLMVRHGQASLDPLETHGLYLRAGTLALNQTENRRAATKAFEAAYELRPDDILPLWLLLDIHRKSGEDVVRRDEIFRRLIEKVEDEKLRISLKEERIESLIEEGALQHAIQLMIELLREGGAQKLLPRLERMLREKGDIDLYIDLARANAERAKDEQERSRRFLSLGRYCLRHNRQENALLALQRAFNLDPSSIEAFSELEALLRRERKDEQLIELYERVLELETRQDRKGILLWQLATLYEVHLDDSAYALELLLKCREIRERDLSVIWGVQRLSRELQKWPELNESLQAELELEEDPQRRALLYLDIAQLESRHLKHPQKAREACRQAIDAAPEHPASHRLLLDLLRNDNRWPQLAQAIEEFLIVAPEEQRAALWVELGDLNEQQLGNEMGAIEAYRQAIEIQPNSQPALIGLERLLRKRKSWTDLREVFEKQIEAYSNPEWQAGRLFLLAENLVEREGQAKEAILAAKKALAIRPNYRPAAQLLERLYAAEGRWGDLADFLEADLSVAGHAQTERAQRARLASLLFWRLEEPQRALEILDGGEGGSPRAIGEDLLQEIIALLGADPKRALAVRQRRAHLTDDKDLAIALLHQVLDGKLDEAQKAATLHQIFILNPLDFCAIERAEALAPDRIELADLWSRRLQNATLEEGLELRLSLAEVIGATHPDMAFELLNEAEIPPDHLPALRMSGNAAYIAEKMDVACKMREREAEGFRDTHARVAAYTEAAKIAEKDLNDDARAIDNLERAFKLAPTRHDLLTTLGALYDRNARWQDKIRMLRRHVEAAEGEEQRASLRSIAEIKLRSLNDPEGASAVLDELLNTSPNDVEALIVLAEIETSLNHWWEAAEALSKALATGEGPSTARRVWRIELCKLYIDHLARYEEAQPELQTLLANDPEDKEALAMLIQLQRQQGQFGESIETLRQLAAAAPPQESVQVRLEIISIAQQQELHDVIEAELSQLALFIQSDPTVLELLAKWAHENGAFGQITPLLEAQRDSLPADQAKLQSQIRMTLAPIYAEHLQRLEDAARESRIAANTLSADYDAQVLAARYQQDHLETRHFATRAMRIDPFRHEAYHLLARACHHEQQPDAAGRCYQAIQSLGAADAVIDRAADELEQRLGNPTAPLGREGALRYLRNTLMPDWVIELLWRAGPKAQVFAIPELPSYPCPDEHPGRALAYRLATVLGINEFECRVTTSEEITAIPDQERPNVLLLGPLCAQGSAAEIRHHLGAALFPSLVGVEVFTYLNDRDFKRLLMSLIGLSHDGWGEPDVIKQLTRVLPRKNRKSVVEHLRTLDPHSLKIDLPQWREGLRLSCLQTGLLASRNLKSSVRAHLIATKRYELLKLERAQVAQALREVDGMRELFQFNMSDNYATARHLLGMNFDLKRAPL